MDVQSRVGNIKELLYLRYGFEVPLIKEFSYYFMTFSAWLFNITISENVVSMGIYIFTSHVWLNQNRISSLEAT